MNRNVSSRYVLFNILKIRQSAKVCCDFSQTSCSNLVFDPHKVILLKNEESKVRLPWKTWHLHFYLFITGM